MDGARHHLLAGAALALDQHGRRAVRDLPDERHHLLEGGADADHVALAQQVVEAPLQRAVLLDQRAALESLPDHAQQLGALERLGQEVDGAVLHRADRLLDRPEGREEDDVHVGRRLPWPPSSSSRPVSPGILRSESRRSTPPWRSRSSAAWPSGASTTP